MMKSRSKRRAGRDRHGTGMQRREEMADDGRETERNEVGERGGDKTRYMRVGDRCGAGRKQRKRGANRKAVEEKSWVMRRGE